MPEVTAQVQVSGSQPMIATWVHASTSIGGQIQLADAQP